MAFGSIRNVHAIDTDRETIGVVGVAVSYIVCAHEFLCTKKRVWLKRKNGVKTFDSKHERKIKKIHQKNRFSTH